MLLRYHCRKLLMINDFPVVWLAEPDMERSNGQLKILGRKFVVYMERKLMKQLGLPGRRKFRLNLQARNKC